MFAVRQRSLGLLAGGYIAGHAEPLKHNAVTVHQRDGPRERPAQCAVNLQNPVLPLKNSFGSDGLAYGLNDMLLVVGVDIFFQPGAVWLVGVGNELAALQVAHFGPVGVHAVTNVRTGTD